MKKQLSKSMLALAIASAAGALNAAVLEEVIVTAQQRAQSLQDVPVSVAALTAGKYLMQVLLTYRDCQK